MANLPAANGLTTSQYLRYLQALSLWNNLQENQQRNYPSVGEMYAYQFPAMLNTLGKQVGDVFAAQGRDQQAAANLANTQAETGYRSAATQSIQDQRALDLMKFYAEQEKGRRAREAEAAYYEGFRPKTTTTETPGPDLMSTAEPGNEMGQAPPIPTSTTKTTTTTPTLMDVLTGMGKQAADLPEKYQENFQKALIPPQPKYDYTAEGPMDVNTGKSPLGVLLKGKGQAPLQGEALKADILRRIDAGEPVSDEARTFAGLAPKPGAPKPFWEGKNETELIGLINDPSTPPDQVKIAQKMLSDLQDRALGKIKAGVDIRTQAKANAPLTPKERNEQSREQNFLGTYDKLEQIAKDHPDWFGPYGTLGYIKSAKLAAGSNDPDAAAFGDFQSLVQQVGVERMHDLFGARLTQQEVDRYRESHPAMGQSLPQFLARLRAARGQMRNVFNSRWGGGGSSGGDSGPLNGSDAEAEADAFFQKKGRGR